MSSRITNNDFDGVMRECPLWLLRLAVIRTMQQSDCTYIPLSIAIRNVNRSPGNCFYWTDTPEGHTWWQKRFGSDMLSYFKLREPMPVEYSFDLMISD
jgi:hypothetical protein